MPEVELEAEKHETPEPGLALKLALRPNTQAAACIRDWADRPELRGCLAYIPQPTAACTPSRHRRRAPLRLGWCVPP